jgi:hypothetical protein
MKTRVKQTTRRFQLKVVYGYAYYTDRISRLEAALARKPRCLRIEMIGVGEIPADSALLIRSVLLARSPKTRIVTVARSSLHNGSVLVWLLGNRRIIRDDAKVYFRPTTLSTSDVVEPDEKWNGEEPKYRDSSSEFDPEEGDYARVLQLINEFLPVRELAGRLVGVPVLRQYGLVDNEKVDEFLTTAFGKSRGALVAR